MRKLERVRRKRTWGKKERTRAERRGTRDQITRTRNIFGAGQNTGSLQSQTANVGLGAVGERALD